MKDLSSIEKIKGYENLSENQRKILFLVIQEHAKLNESVSPQNAIKVTVGDHANQVHVHYKNDWYHYEIDTKTGRPIWY